ncbi:nucleotide-binding domain-containing protein [Testicularia cyperi]|uniref:Nucleotide-binding domain-containing protein n=1 Tax=Testicularia cyperi TaxID=1882483 RepID=A0A317XUV6_9BASI|nr:nucleotide-binding domain-containing protein [Testicularia cyperi]
MRATTIVRAAAAAEASTSSASSASAASGSSSALARPMRLAIVGAGPSGFYAASRLLSKNPYSASHSLAQQPLKIDIFDRLPTPHGLVRYGVAPDHPDVKNVEHKFDALAQDPRLRFAGNVNVVHSLPSASDRANVPYPHAVQLPLETLSRHYTHILFSYGSSSGRPLGIPGSASGELENVYTALSFVNWYNGHPASHDPSLNLFPSSSGAAPFSIDLSDKRHLTLIGAGNVALDVARIVLRSSTPFLSPSETLGRPTSNKGPGLAALEQTDVPEPVLAELARSKIDTVDIFARRGPAQLAFTNKEVREMLAIQGIALRPPPPEALKTAIQELEHLASSSSSSSTSSNSASVSEEDQETANKLASEVRVKKRLLGLLEKGSKTKHSPADNNVKTWALNFFHSPARFLSDASETRGLSQPAQTGKPKVTGVEWNLTAPRSGAPTERNLDASSPGKVAWGDANGATAGTTSPAPDTTGKTRCTSTDIVVSSVGYRSEPLWSSSSSPSPSTSTLVSSDSKQSTQHLTSDQPTRVTCRASSLTLPFDTTRNIIPNLGGRVVDPVTHQPIPGVYVSGWLARGPIGVIASTMLDAYSVADTILHDHNHLPPPSSSPPFDEVDSNDLLDSLQSSSQNKIITFEDWIRINALELERGKLLGKNREKFIRVQDMLLAVS